MSALLDLMTTEWLSNRSLFGINLTNDAGDPFPDEMFELSVEAAAEILETELNLSLLDVVTIEDEGHDLFDQDPERFYIKFMHHRPVWSVTSIKIAYGNFTPIALPTEWSRVLTPVLGEVAIVPGPGGVTTLQGPFPGSSNFVWPANGWIPHYFRHSYTAGFDGSPGREWPKAVLDSIAIIASFLPLDTAGDLIAGAGVASSSVSLPGISASVSTTSSATNSGYGAREIQYQNRLKMNLRALKRKYRMPETFSI